MESGKHMAQYRNCKQFNMAERQNVQRIMGGSPETWQDPRQKYLVFHARKLKFSTEEEEPQSDFKEGNDMIKFVSFYGGWARETTTMACSGQDAYEVIRERKHDVPNARAYRETGKKGQFMSCLGKKSQRPGLCGMQQREALQMTHQT